MPAALVVPPAPAPAPPAAAAPTPYPVTIDFEALTRNFARLVEEGGRVAAAYLKPREQGTRKVGYSDEIADAVKTLGHVMEYWYTDPQRAIEVQTRLGKSYLELFAGAARRFAGDGAVALCRARSAR